MASGFSKDLVNDNDPSLDDNILDLLTEDDSPILSLSPGPSLPPPPPPQQQLQQRQQQPVSKFQFKHLFIFGIFFVKSRKRGKMISRGFFFMFYSNNNYLHPLCHPPQELSRHHHRQPRQLSVPSCMKS